jgi:uncharacterized membrane protein YphA (DoxX/SURF4 family)
MTKKRIAIEVLAWFLSLWLAFIFAKAGIAKFDDGSGWAAAFRNWHFPVWFRLLIGVVETLAAALVLWPRTASYGAALMAVVMLGAIGTFAVHHRMHPAPITALVVAVVVLLLRRRNALPLTGIENAKLKIEKEA